MNPLFSLALSKFLLTITMSKMTVCCVRVNSTRVASHRILRCVNTTDAERVRSHLLSCTLLELTVNIIADWLKAVFDFPVICCLVIVRLVHICIQVYVASTTQNMYPSDHYQTTYDSKTKIVVFYLENKIRQF